MFVLPTFHTDITTPFVKSPTTTKPTINRRHKSEKLNEQDKKILLLSEDGIKFK